MSEENVHPVNAQVVRRHGGPRGGTKRKIVWAEAQIWAAGEKFVPLGPELFFSVVRKAVCTWALFGKTEEKWRGSNKSDSG